MNTPVGKEDLAINEAIEIEFLKAEDAVKFMLTIEIPLQRYQKKKKPPRYCFGGFLFSCVG